MGQVLEIIAITFSTSSFVISSITLVSICIYIRPLISNVPILLTCNTYITVIGSSLMTVLVMVYGLIDARHVSIMFNNYSCQLRSYINYVFICAFYYSCALQAIFRLFRVVWPKRKILQTRVVALVSIFLQWLVPIFYIAVYLFLGNFEYRAEIGSCWLSFKNISALATGMVFIYGSPLAVMTGIYACIIRYIRRTVQTQQIRAQANKRDLFIVKRIIILVLISMGIGIPTGMMLIIYMINGYLHPLAYHIQALSLTLGLLVESIALGFITPQVREIFNRNRRRIIPAITDQRTLQAGIEPVDDTL